MIKVLPLPWIEKVTKGYATYCRTPVKENWCWNGLGILLHPLPPSSLSLIFLVTISKYLHSIELDVFSKFTLNKINYFPLHCIVHQFIRYNNFIQNIPNFYKSWLNLVNNISITNIFQKLNNIKRLWILESGDKGTPIVFH